MHDCEDEDSTGMAGDEQDCGKCGCRIVSESNVSFCGKVIVSEDADCEESLLISLSDMVA